MQQNVSVPAVERAGWQSRRVRRLPGSAYLYAGAVLSTAAVAASAAISGADGAIRSEDWLTLALLLPLAALAPLVGISIGRNLRFHASSVFILPGALLLPPALLVAFLVLIYVPQWAKQRLPWYIWAFNTANTVLAALAARAIADVPPDASDLRVAGASLAAGAGFVAVNHLLLAPMLRLARGHSFRESGLFSPLSLGIDYVLAGLGIAVALFVVTNPWLLPTLVAPLALAHRSLSVQALLRESEERFRAMFGSAPMGTMLIRLDGAIISVNRAFEELVGYDGAELLQLDQTAYVHADDIEEGHTRFAELAAGERDIYRRDARYVNSKGEIVFVHVAVALVRDADTRPQFAIAMIEDVTEQRELEERLRQSQKLEAIGRLAGGVAHDFNNMLTAIGGYNTLALEHAPEESALRSDLEEIGKATERATLLTRQLLAFSRKQILQPELLNLNAVILELESMLRPLIGEDVVLTTALDPALGPIEADPGQLQQVLMNLVVNARDAMPGGGALVIETANAEVGEGDATIEPGRYVTLTVRDSGHGIDAETLKQIFEPFFTTKDVGKGTGLGLATVYGIVKQSGGYVVVESEPGVGTAFAVYLPREIESRAARTDATPAPAAEPAAEAGPERSTETVLLVEDEEVVRRLVRQVLEGGGYRVLEAADGREALELARSAPVDLLLTDLVMPKLGGRELAAELRRATPTLKVIYMSGYADGDILENGVLQPGTELLEKPFAFADLTARVRRVLDS